MSADCCNTTPKIELDFGLFKEAVAQQWKIITSLPQQCVRMDVSKEQIWDTYINSFPEGTNPIFRERTEHDCVYCKQFVRAVGNIAVLTKDGNILTLWDCNLPEGHPYAVVAKAMAELVRNARIRDAFLHTEPSAGVDTNKAQLDSGTVVTWRHFHAKIPKALHNSAPGKALGQVRSTYDVLRRGLEEITAYALETFIELVDQNSLYRGEEFVANVKAFLQLKEEYIKLESDRERELFAWRHALDGKQHVTRVRNTAAGTLLQNLSEDMDLEKAVKKYESVVAPTNYKRPTALVTKGMIKKAEETVTELGLMDALPRRYAVTEDVTINNVLFADRNTKPLMKNAFQEMAEDIGESDKSLKKLDKVEEISSQDFVEKILPKATGLEVLVENRHVPNFMTLLAPVNPEAKGMLKWPNNFSWSYNGEIADSMRELVKAAGGRVDGAFRFTMSWNHTGQNQSLMDLHCFMPGNNPQMPKPGKKEVHDNYGNYSRVGWNNRQHAASGGVQDVDNVNPPGKRVPIENISFPTLGKMPEGKYVLKVHNWNNRPPNKTGFHAEIEYGDELYQYEYLPALGHKEWITVATVTLKSGKFEIEHHLPTSTSSKDVWGIATQTFRKVNMVMNSPNHWDDNAVGNQHLFFILDGCLKEGDARGFYNEFLSNSLTDHRKVFEHLGSRLKAPASDQQLSGLGFSSTQRNHVFVRVKGAFERTLKVTF
jgi:hypothetical protein